MKLAGMTRCVPAIRHSVLAIQARPPPVSRGGLVTSHIPRCNGLIATAPPIKAWQVNCVGGCWRTVCVFEAHVVHCRDAPSVTAPGCRHRPTGPGAPRVAAPDRTGRSPAGRAYRPVPARNQQLAVAAGGLASAIL